MLSGQSFASAKLVSTEQHVHGHLARSPRERRSFTKYLLPIGAAFIILYTSVTKLSVNFLRATPDFSHIAHHCSHVPPIPSTTFIARQDTLAQTLNALNASAYIAEPGANAAFFANISGDHWHLSERPLLVVITPQVGEGGRVYANVSILTPAFEATRAKLLPIPAASKLTFLEWPEDVDPYGVAMAAISRDGPVFVDSNVRHFIVDGLQKTSPNRVIVSAPSEIISLRERKSNEEIEIMKCANEVTVLVIRAVQEVAYIGIRESEMRQLIESGLYVAGLKNPFALVLFGENAALPHGSGTDRALNEEDFALVDCGGSLHGYESDITRTFAIPSSRIPADHLLVWHIVQNAQFIAMRTARNGTVTAHVDHAARAAIAARGYGPYFTHRLGHGIGLEGHESPYLRGGSDDLIMTGHTFSNEPGIYIEGEVGVRLEDCFYINEEGVAVYLTAGVGGQAISPWEL